MFLVFGNIARAVLIETELRYSVSWERECVQGVVP